jgi:hypothetical protein
MAGCMMDGRPCSADSQVCWGSAGLSSDPGKHAHDDIRRDEHQRSLRVAAAAAATLLTRRRGGAGMWARAGGEGDGVVGKGWIIAARDGGSLLGTSTAAAQAAIARDWCLLGPLARVPRPSNPRQGSWPLWELAKPVDPILGEGPVYETSGTPACSMHDCAPPTGQVSVLLQARGIVVQASHLLGRPPTHSFEAG